MQKPRSPHSCSAGLGLEWRLPWSQGTRFLPQPLLSLSDILKQVSTVYLCPGCSAPEPSVPREHQVDFTRTRTGWVCAHSIPSVVACCAACYRPTHQGSAASPQEQSRRLTQQQVITDGTVTRQTHPSSRKGTAGGCTPGHVSLCCPSDTLKVLSPSRRPCRREAACWAAAESV